eukprot:CAMPEP_0184111348 /NCGR_PEP_ID=MMETSP0974-20121125/17862_1 /TAXON_ID=483370 /ORGANISM="non described non described, Strain CCMP2097" /LENGTH=99 /DNA_ID=CAMNT_0026414425 /DNA_START=80 /DNA_END=379 /DNA_ORIENTATION=-
METCARERASGASARREVVAPPLEADPARRHRRGAEADAAPCVRRRAVGRSDGKEGVARGRVFDLRRGLCRGVGELDNCVNAPRTASARKREIALAGAR